MCCPYAHTCVCTPYVYSSYLHVLFLHSWLVYLRYVYWINHSTLYIYRPGVDILVILNDPTNSISFYSSTRRICVYIIPYDIHTSHMTTWVHMRYNNIAYNLIIPRMRCLYIRECMRDVILSYMLLMRLCTRMYTALMSSWLICTVFTSLCDV